MEIRGKRLVVVGGAGLIGSHVVEALVSEDVGEIIVYDNFVRGVRSNLTSVLNDPRVRIFDLGGDILQTDLLDQAFKGADGVFHFAALWLLHCHEFPRSAFETNIRGTFNVLESCVRNRVSRLVYSSSASVYGDALEEPMTEDHPLNGVNFYGATKIAGEAMLRAFAHRYQLPAVGLRYMNVYGPRQDYRGAYVAVIMKMLDAIDQGKPIPIYGDGSQAYDFVYVTDCATANVCAMKANTTDRFYNVGTGVRTSIKQIAELIMRETNAGVGIDYLPAGLTFVRNRVGSTSRAENEIGFRAKVGLDEGIRTLVSWRRSDVDAKEAAQQP